MVEFQLTQLKTRLARINLGNSKKLPFRNTAMVKSCPYSPIIFIVFVYNVHEGSTLFSTDVDGIMNSRNIISTKNIAEEYYPTRKTHRTKSLLSMWTMLDLQFPFQPCWIILLYFKVLRNEGGVWIRSIFGSANFRISLGKSFFI